MAIFMTFDHSEEESSREEDKNNDKEEEEEEEEEEEKAKALESKRNIDGGSTKTAMMASPSSSTEDNTSYSFHIPRAKDLPSLAAAWPVISSIAMHLDQNDLSNLASVCKQMRQNMLQFRNGLLDTSLVCKATEPVFDKRMLQLPCVRDLVKECVTCRKATCRNCVYRAALRWNTKRHLTTRLRKVCQGCQDDPSWLPGHEKFKPTRNICKCHKEIWQCNSCRSTMAPDNHHLCSDNSFITKLRIIQFLSCPHFYEEKHSPDCRRVWVEPCPSKCHQFSFNQCVSSSIFYPGVAECAMESYQGGWAWQDESGYIFKPSLYSCVGNTRLFWDILWSNPNAGFVTYENDEERNKNEVKDVDRFLGRRTICHGDMIKIVGFSDRNPLDDVREPVTTLLDKEIAGEVRAHCTWCKGLVYSQEDERIIEERGFGGM